jgi:hypothetical protein
MAEDDVRGAVEPTVGSRRQDRHEMENLSEAFGRHGIRLLETTHPTPRHETA